MLPVPASRFRFSTVFAITALLAAPTGLAAVEEAEDSGSPATPEEEVSLPLVVHLHTTDGATTRDFGPDSIADAILVPTGTRVRIELSSAASAPSASPDPNGARAIRIEETSDINWEAETGSLALLDTSAMVRWLPDAEGRLDTVTVRRRTTSLGRVGDRETGLWSATGSGSVTLLPGAHFDRNGPGIIGGTVIGIYPNELSESAPGPVRRNTRSYTPPSTFYRLDDDTRQLAISRRATMGELNPAVFEDEGARYVAFNPDLALFWDALCDVVAENGKDWSALRVLRGYVSPQDRLRLQRMGVNLAEFTRYQYGDAIAIIYDADHNFRMDDLDGDGEVNRADAEMLSEWVEQAMRNAGLAGGIGVSARFDGPNHIGTPYVHADLRGWMERWRE